MIIEDDEYEYIDNMMLKNRNKVFDWETYKQITDGRTMPILGSKVGNLITYKWPDTGEIFPTGNQSFQWDRQNDIIGSDFK